MADQYEVLEKMVEDIEAELDKVEANAKKFGYDDPSMPVSLYPNDDIFAIFHSQWLGLWKQKTALDAELYQITFPDSKIEFNETGTRFEVI